MIKIGDYEFDVNDFDIDKVDLSLDPPAKEPARQYYFMAKARTILRERFEADVRSGAALKRYGREKLEDMLARKVSGTFAVVTFVLP